MILALVATGWLAGCAGANVRYDRPIALSGNIGDIAACTMEKMAAAGYMPPRLTYVPVVRQPRSYIVYRTTPSFAPSVGLQLLRIDFEQLSAARAQARLSPAGIGGAPIAATAVPILEGCQSG